MIEKVEVRAMKAVVPKQRDGQKGNRMKTLTISVSLPLNVEVDEQTAKELLVLSLLSGGRLSQSQAAQVLGVSRYDLLELMGQHGVPVLRYGPGEIEKEERHLLELQAIRERERVSQAVPSSAPQRSRARAAKSAVDS